MCDPCAAALRRLSGIWGLAGLIVVASVYATRAPAAPAPVLFELTVSGAVSQQWTYTAAPDVDGACTRTETSEGIRNVQFRTARPVLVRLVAGRVLPTVANGLTGIVTLAGANTMDEDCGGAGAGRIEDCVQTKRSFSRARVRVSSRRPGSVDVSEARGVRLPASDCPREPVDVRRRPLGPALQNLRLPAIARDDERVSRMTVRASAARRTGYALPAAGNLRERAQWTLTFVRVKA